MSRTIFINLAIDQTWDQDHNLEKIFPVRLPESEYLVRMQENMGLFLSENGDKVLAFQSTPGFLEMLRARCSSWGELIEIDANPYDQTLWLRQVGDRLGKPFKIDVQNEDSRQINRKDFLYELGRQGLLPVPPTQILTQQRLLQGDFSPFSREHFLKYGYGSGGGGNFLLKDHRDPTLVFLQRRLAEQQTHTPWLLQEKIPSVLEGSVFGFLESSEDPQICKVSYDGHGLSYRHQFQIDDPMVGSVRDYFDKVKNRLVQENYRGPLGLDFLVSNHHQQVYFVDLNLRWTKTHLISAALGKLGLKKEDFVSLRFRWKSPHRFYFEKLWGSIRQELKLDARGTDKEGRTVFPYLATGVESLGPQKEISLFVSGESSFENRVKEVLTHLSQQGEKK